MENKKPIIVVLPDPDRGKVREIQAMEELEKRLKLADKRIETVVLSDIEDVKLLDHERPMIVIDNALYFDNDRFNVIVDKLQDFERETIVYGGRGDTAKNQRTRRKLSQIGIAGNIPGFETNSQIINIKSQKVEEHMKSRLSMIGMLAGMAAAMSTGTSVKGEREYYESQIGTKESKPKGNRFVIEGVEIYALNRKNAERKYRNLKNKKS